MPFDDSRLAALKAPRGRFLEDEESGQGVFHVDSLHTYIQAAGYLKFYLGKNNRGGVFFRGQTRLYSSMVPGLYRGAERQVTKEERHGALIGYLERVEEERRVLRAVDPRVREPLLQHYGLRTRWIDLVDNAWVALWFACFNAVTTGKLDEYLHFERRGDPAGEDLRERFAYIVLMEAEMSPDPEMEGWYRGDDTELVDLRVAAPSHFVRPHAQHGVLLKRKILNLAIPEATDYIDLVRGAIRIPLSKALAWLGNGGLTQVHTLFPPPSYDYGYLELLRGAPDGMPRVGAIHHVGA